MSYLSRPWRVHDIDDAERLVLRVLDDSLRARGAHLVPHQREDAAAYLLGVLFELSQQWDPSRSPSFSTWAFRTLKLRMVDFWRSELGRTKWAFAGGHVHHRARRDVVSLNTNHSEQRRLDETLATRRGDPADDRDPDFRRLVSPGTQQVARDLALLGLEPDERAA